VKGISSLRVFPSFGSFEQGCGGPSADFFENRTVSSTCGCLVVTICSDDMYSLPDSSESSLLDLFGSSMSASSSIALAADGIAWARTMNDDSVETDTALVHIDLDGMVTSVCLGLDGTINSTHLFWVGPREYSMCHGTEPSGCVRLSTYLHTRIGHLVPPRISTKKKLSQW
jgi:hypothetical protein